MTIARKIPRRDFRRAVDETLAQYGETLRMLSSPEERSENAKRLDEQEGLS